MAETKPPPRDPVGPGGILDAVVRIAVFAISVLTLTYFVEKFSSGKIQIIVESNEADASGEVGRPIPEDPLKE